MRHRAIGLAALVAIHIAALAILIRTEEEPAAWAAFALTWGALNFLWLVLLRRPLIGGALSLTVIVTLIVVSQFKQSILLMTATFVDLMIVDLSTVAFIITVIPGLAWKIALLAGTALPLLAALWWLEPFRVGRVTALARTALCLAALAALSLAVPTDREDEFNRRQYVSKFARSSAVAVVDILTRGVFEADAATAGRLDPPDAAACPPAAKLPHIIMIHDESSFDVTMMPGIQVAPNYQAQFRSSDGKRRSFVVEGAGGPSWFTEYNVLAGLSVRSYGHFADSVTRIAAGRVQRGLPLALHRCGYTSYTLFSWLGSFVGARAFQRGVGIDHFYDAGELGSTLSDPDGFYYDRAIAMLAREHDHGPAFLYVFLSMNHFPWDYRFGPDLLPSWANLGNPSGIDEYLRRQELSRLQFAQFKQQLAAQFPGEPFLIVRYGDHQPEFAKHLLEPDVDEAAVADRIRQADPRYLTTYYAIDAVNFQPADTSSALETLDAPYLPLVILEAAGIPLDPSFAEQKKILQRCNGWFYSCRDGAETRRFNRLLIDAGLIKGF